MVSPRLLDKIDPVADLCGSNSRQFPFVFVILPLLPLFLLQLLLLLPLLMALAFKSVDINMLYCSSSRSIPLIMRLWWISFSCCFLLSARKSSRCFFPLLSEAALFRLLLGCALLLSPDGRYTHCLPINMVTNSHIIKSKSIFPLLSIPVRGRTNK